LTLWGEVVSIKRGSSLPFLTLVDADDPALTVEVRVACDLTSVNVGDLVGVSGRLVPTKPAPSTIEVVFAAERFEGTRGPSRRQLDRQALVARHRRRHGRGRRFLAREGSPSVSRKRRAVLSLNWIMPRKLPLNSLIPKKGVV